MGVVTSLRVFLYFSVSPSFSFSSAWVILNLSSHLPLSFCRSTNIARRLHGTAGHKTIMSMTSRSSSSVGWGKPILAGKIDLSKSRTKSTPRLFEKDGESFARAYKQSPKSYTMRKESKDTYLSCVFLKLFLLNGSTLNGHSSSSLSRSQSAKEVFRRRWYGWREEKVGPVRPECFAEHRKSSLLSRAEEGSVDRQVEEYKLDRVRAPICRYSKGIRGHLFVV